MRQDIQVLDRVKSAYASLRVQVSQPTVVRFVQAMGFDGYLCHKGFLLIPC